MHVIFSTVFNVHFKVLWWDALNGASVEGSLTT